ncbi:hypothetical protein MYX65_11950, partial [Acidobacteria bacterium AH-259-L09]|nr:hypothetical protein [Acidobacteria bacterium AH-259-L09]
VNVTDVETDKMAVSVTDPIIHNGPLSVNVTDVETDKGNSGGKRNGPIICNASTICTRYKC